MRTNGARCVLGLLDEPHERRVGALGGRPRRAQLERAPGRAVPLRTLPPRRTVTGSGSPVSADSSTIASSLIDHAVDRDDLAGAHEHDVADGDLVDGHLDELVAAAHQRRSAAPARRARSARGARGRFADSSSALPPASISATTAPARYSPSASAPAIATSAIASTPTSRRSSERTTDQVSGTSSIAVVAAQSQSAGRW